MAEQENAGASVSDAMTKEDADKTRVLVREDIRTCELAIARHEAAIGEMRVRIAECQALLADVDRREAGVEYPKPVKKDDQGQPEAK